MASYAVYIRTREGYIERMKNIISHLPHITQPLSESSNPYVYEEALVGFPEPMVFWATNTGSSVGIAPLNPDSHARKAANMSVGMNEST